MGNSQTVLANASEGELWRALMGGLRRAEADLVNIEPRKLPLREVRMALDVARELRKRGVQLSLDAELNRPTC